MAFIKRLPCLFDALHCGVNTALLMNVCSSICSDFEAINPISKSEEDQGITEWHKPTSCPAIQPLISVRTMSIREIIVRLSHYISSFAACLTKALLVKPAPLVRARKAQVDSGVDAELEGAEAESSQGG